MKIRLLQDCKHGNNGEIIEMRPMLANMLRLRKKAEAVYRIGELCFGEMSYVQDLEINTLRSDEVSDISFYLAPLSIGILKYYPATFYKGMVATFDYYKLIDDGKSYKSNKSFNNQKIERRDIVVNASTVRKFTDIQSELDLRGWDENTYLSKYEIREFQEQLDDKYNLYRGITRFER